MSWEVEYLPEANQDLKNLDGSQRQLVLKAIKKVQQNPISIYEGGYGKPLGNKNGSDLSGFLKVKLKNAGLRVVYKVVRQDDKMLIIVIGARADEEVYGIAQKRILDNNL
ncbi:MAG: type II toxin-antitoxin system RelE/ParE family toxin [Oscillospiraceae bacterium]|nr:type II toxin-antitoxin system RelE/ParE family toxin [Oscillospiraceae bacterium]